MFVERLNKTIHMKQNNFIIQNSLQYTPGDIVVKVYSLARTVADTLRSNGLLFWTSGGTTLGQNQVRCL